MTADKKRKTLVCLGGVVILTMLIATALPYLELKPGVPLPEFDNGGATSLQAQALPMATFSISIFGKALLSICLLVVLIYNGYRVLRSVPWRWRDFLNSVIQIGAILMIAFGILYMLSGVSFTPGPAVDEWPTPVVVEPGPPLGTPHLGLLWIVGLGLAVALVGVGLWIIFHPVERTADRLMSQAEWALQALQKGENFRNVIVRCYWQMGQVLSEEQGIEMENEMTVREFERLLETRGVPYSPVHQLTQLFETVRYGHRPTTAEDERQAIDALTAIVQYSRAISPQRSQ